jgi:hypothetical protein
MTLYQITVYHNDESRFMPYEDGHRLTAAVSNWLSLPATTEPEALADWAWHVFNADLDHLEPGRTRPDGELAFLAACVYRLLHLRSLSVGDVIAIANGTAESYWLACDTIGWKHISQPSNIAGAPLTAQKVYQHLQDQRRTR